MEKHISNLVSDGQNWLEKAQNLMVDMASYGELSQLVGKLYNLSVQATNTNQELGNKDPNAVAFARAYSDALDYKKHGRKISLPSHLTEKLPMKLRKYCLTC